MATMWVMTMMVKTMVAAVVGMAISLQGAEEKGRRTTQDNQLNDNNKAAYDVHKNNGIATYNDDVTSSVTIGWTPAQLGRQRQSNNDKDASPTMPAQQRRRHQRYAGKMQVRRGRRRQCNDRNNGMMATMPAKQWFRRQHNVHVNASGTPVKMSLQWWRQHGCNEGDNASTATATTRRRRGRQ